MESQNFFTGFFLSKEEKKAQEKKQVSKNIKNLLPTQKLIKTQQVQQTSPKVIKRKESKIITGKELTQKIIKKEINIQQLVFEISNLQEEIKVFKQENQELSNLLQLGQDNFEIRIINKERELQAYQRTYMSDEKQIQTFILKIRNKRLQDLKQSKLKFDIKTIFIEISSRYIQKRFKTMNQKVNYINLHTQSQKQQ